MEASVIDCKQSNQQTQSAKEVGSIICLVTLMFIIMYWAVKPFGLIFILSNSMPDSVNRDIKGLFYDEFTSREIDEFSVRGLPDRAIREISVYGAESFTRTRIYSESNYLVKVNDNGTVNVYWERSIVGYTKEEVVADLAEKIRYILSVYDSEYKKILTFRL